MYSNHDGRRFGAIAVNEIVRSSLKNQWPQSYSLTRQLAVEPCACDGNPGRFLIRLRSVAVSEAVRVSDYMEKNCRRSIWKGLNPEQEEAPLHEDGRKQR